MTWPNEHIRSAVWKVAKNAAIGTWQTGSSDTTQMLMCVRDAFEAVAEEFAIFPDSWEGLEQWMDTHWPEDIFLTVEDRPNRDPGLRILSLLRRLAAAELGVVQAECGQ